MEFPEDSLHIPAAFHSFEQDGPFTHCKICGGVLAACPEGYLIEKAYKGGEVLFEHAVCEPCRARVEAELSPESRERIMAHFAARVGEVEVWVDPQGRPDHEAALAECILKERPPAGNEEYQIYARCEGDRLAYPFRPYMLCGEAIDEIVDLLSEKTRGFLDDYMAEHFGPPSGAKRQLILV